MTSDQLWAFMRYIPPISSKPPPSGFTLIEVLVVVSLTVMLLLTASTLFMTFLISNTKTSSNILIKNEGNYANAQIEFLIRNAVDILPNSDDQICAAGMDELVLKSIDGGITTITAVDDISDSSASKIASSSGTVDRFLTSSSITLLSGPTFNCTQTADQASPYITTTFTLQKGTPGVDLDRDVSQQSFGSSVSIRNF